MERRISSRLTVVSKFIVPLITWAFVLLFVLPNFIRSSFAPSDCLLLAMGFGLAAALMWEPVVLKRIKMDDTGLTISNFLEADRVPFAMIERVVEPKWFNLHLIKLVLNKPCRFGRTIYFIPSRIEACDAPFLPSILRRWSHPTVRELRRRIEEIGGCSQQCPGAHSSGPVENAADHRGGASDVQG